MNVLFVNTGFYFRLELLNGIVLYGVHRFLKGIKGLGAFFLPFWPIERNSTIFSQYTFLIHIFNHMNICTFDCVRRKMLVVSLLLQCGFLGLNIYISNVFLFDVFAH